MSDDRRPMSDDRSQLLAQPGATRQRSSVVTRHPSYLRRDRDMAILVEHGGRLGEEGELGSQCFDLAADLQQGRIVLGRFFELFDEGGALFGVGG